MNTDYELKMKKNNEVREKYYGSTKKNYAPCTVPQAKGISSTQAIYAHRQQMRKLAAISEIADKSAMAPISQELINIKADKRAKSAAYTQRIATKLAKFSQFTLVPSNISPYLNLHLFGDMTHHDRLLTYTRRHKCEHGRCYSGYRVESNLEITGKLVPNYLVPLCYCVAEIATPQYIHTNCMRCTGTKLRICKPIKCITRLCIYCKTVQYVYEDKRYLIRNEIVFKEVPKPITTRIWDPVPELETMVKEMSNDEVEDFRDCTEESPKKMGVGKRNFTKEHTETTWTTTIKDTIMAFINKIRQAIQTGIDYITKGVKKVYMHSLKYKLMNAFMNLCTGIGDVIIKRPLLFAHQFYRLLVTTSTIERHVVLANVLMFGPLKELYDVVLNLLGLGISEKVNVMNRQSGGDYSQIFFKLLDVPVKLMKSASIMEPLKKFNTLMSSWKNLHELITSLLEHLPYWMTAIFVDTDPRKRYSTEARRPGNPIYDMVQCYLDLYKLGTLESLVMFESRWKLADEYLMTSYPLHMQVLQLHKHYLITARTIIRPTTVGSRPIPFVVTLCGKPGMGKSSMWPLFLSGVVKAKSLNEIRDITYVRNTSSDFFDGYNPDKHKIFLYDDFAHIIDDPSADELISIVSSAQFMPNFASLNDTTTGMKGTAFNSPIVVINANFSNFLHCKQIADKVALQRRLGIVINVDKRYGPDITYLVERSEIDGKKTEVGNMTLAEIQKFLGDEYKRHFAQQESVDDTFNKLLCANLDLDFQDIYNKRSRGEPAVQEMYGMEAFGYGLLVAYTYDLCATKEKTIRTYAQMLLVAGTAFTILYVAMKSMFGETVAEVESGETSTAKNASKVFFARKEAGNSQDEVVVNKILQNCVQVIRDDGQYVNAVFICGNVLLINNHVLDDPKPQVLSIVSQRACDNPVYDINLKECKIIPFKGVDLALIQMPKHVAAYIDLRKYLANSAVNDHTYGYVTRRDMTSKNVFVHEVEIIPGLVRIEVNEKDGTRSVSTDTVRYVFKHKQGDCGSLVLAPVDGNLKIVAFHSGGSITDSLKSFGVLINKKEIESYVAKLPEFSTISREEEFPYEVVTLEQGKTMNKTHYVATTSVPIYSPMKTDIIPSLIFDKVAKHTTKPALLRRTEEHDPMINALNKYGKSTKQFPIEQTVAAVKSMTEQLMALKKSTDIARVLTDSEAINGIPGQIESMNFTTSAGYPHVLNSRERGAKRQYFVGEVGSLKMDKRASDVVDHWKQCFDNNLIPSDPYIATLKDERRKIEKVNAGKTRVFAAGTLAGFYWNKRMFGGFNKFMLDNRTDTFSTLGMNRASGEWDEMIRTFKSVSEYGFDGDQEEWDGRFKSYLALEMLELFTAFYNDGEENKKIRYILLMQAVHCYIRVSWCNVNAIVLVLGCMPSGCFLTYLLNSLVNAGLFRIAWQVLVCKPYNDLYYFREYVKEKYAGDDNLLSVAVEFLDQFNAVKVAEFFRQYDQIYTPAAKGGDLIPFQKIEECLFLKTKTGKMYGNFVPLFDMEANCDTMNWIRVGSGITPFVATEDNCNDVLRNMFFYGIEEFEKYRALMLLALPQLNLIDFGSLKATYLGYGKLPDPYGTFGFTRNNTRDPRLLLKAVGEILTRHDREDCEQMELRAMDIMMKESGKMTEGERKCIRNEIRQAEYSIQLQSKIEVQLEQERPSPMRNATTISNELKQNRYSTHLQRQRIALLSAQLEACVYVEVMKRESGFKQPVADLATKMNEVQDAKSSIDDSTPTVTTKVGVHLSEQQSLVSIGAVNGNTRVTSSFATAHLNEPAWDLQAMLLRENLVAAFTWALTDPVGMPLTIIGTAPLDVPADLLQNNLVATPFLRFIYWRCKKVQVRFQLTASRFHQGRLLVAFVPSMMPKDQYTMVPGVTRMTHLQHCILDPANGTVASLDIPFIFNKGYIDLAFGDILGQIHCRVLNQLQAATGASTTVEVKVFVSFEESEFKVPRPSGESFRALLKHEQRKRTKEEWEVLTRESGVPAIIYDEPVVVPATIIRDEVVEVMQREAGICSKIGGDLDKLVESVLPKELIQAAEIILDKPAITEIPPLLVLKDQQYLSNSRGVENLERLSLEPSAQYLTQDQLGSSIDELDMNYLLSKEVYLTTFNWPASATVGTILQSGIVSPRHFAAANLSAISFEPSLLGWLSYMFTYWRGGIELIFHIVGTAFHEGRLDVAFHPATDTPPTDYVTSQSQYVVSHTVRNVDNIIRVVIPHLSDIPWKRVWNGEELSTTVETNSDRFQDFAHGCYSMRVAVPLKAPNNVAQNVDINLFVRAAGDFEFHTLSPYSGVRFIQNPFGLGRKSRFDKKKEVMKRQAGDLNEIEVDDTGLALAVARAKTYNTRIAHFGESYSNLREMMKRYVITNQMEVECLPGVATFIQFNMFGSDFNGMIGQMFRVFRMFRGSMNFKLSAASIGHSTQAKVGVQGVITSTIQPVSQVTPPPNTALAYFNPSNLSSAQIPLIRFSDTQVAEFSVPFQSIYHALLNYTEDDSGIQFFANSFTNFNLIGSIYPLPITAAAVTLTLSVSLGDESRLGVFLGVPLLLKATPVYPLPSITT